MSKKIAIGFDLGTTSVGWSVMEINDSDLGRKLQILDMGVRLFDDPVSNDSNVETRRIARGRRRRINRLKIRKNDLFKLLIKFNLVKDEEEFKKYICASYYDEIEENYKLPIEIKIKGLSNKLSKHELILILHNYIKHRGSLNTIDLSEEEEKEKEKDKNIYDQTLYPCENQYQWFLTTGKTLGNKGNYLITNEQFIKEIKLILSNQKHLNVNEQFINEFIDLFKRHRHYSEGPGSEKSLTKYGRVEQIKDEKGNMKFIWKGGNLWDLLIGKCTYYPSEDRNYKKSPITELFNLLNDLSNLKILDVKNENDTIERFLTYKEKQKAISSPEEKLTLDKIIKELGFSKKHIVSGLKGISDDKPTIEKMESARSIIKWLNQLENPININLNKKEDLLLIDFIFSIGVKKQNSIERLKEFISEQKNLQIKGIVASEEQLKKLANLKIYSSGTSSLSKKAQLEFIDFSLKDGSEGMNQMNYFLESENHREKLDRFSKYKFFPENYFENQIMPSTVKRTFNQATKVLNGILKKYQDYEISHIVIEMARELNSKEEADRITRELNKNKKFIDERMKFHGITEDQLKGGEKRLKFLLWDQQNRHDIYDGQEIKLNDLLSNSTAYHIDHVLPISISFIDSMQNKVVTKAINNENKKDKTPYQWLSSIGRYEEYKERCLSLLNEVQDKKRKLKLQNKINNYLLYEKDPFSELSGFVERQLNDTRYISREFLNQLSDFFKQSNYWKQRNKVIINVINGSLTTFARKNLFSESDCEKKLLIKDRDVYNHHAIDASIIAYLGLNKNIETLLKYKSKNIIETNVNGEKKYVDKHTGVVVAEKQDFFESAAKESLYFRDQMRNFLNPKIKNQFVRFSRMKISKNNIPLSNETLYSIKKIDNDDYKITRLSILEEEKKDLSKYFGKDAQDKEKLLIYRNDPVLYAKLNEIYNDEKYNIDNKISPFMTYLKSKFVEETLKTNNIDLIDKLPIFNKNLAVTHWVKKIKVIENKVDRNDLLILKSHNNNAFYDSLKFVGVRIYKTKQNKYQTIFLSVLNLKWDSKLEKLVIDEKKLNNMLERFNIDKNKGFIEVKRGMTLIKNNDLFYFNGGGDRKQNRLEIKSLICKNELAHLKTNWKEAPNGNRWQISISTIANEFKLCKVDILGNVYDIYSFDQYFEKMLK